WDHDSIDACVRQVAEQEDLKLGKIAQPMRSALCGRTNAPGVFDVLAALAQSEAIARLEDQV
ncbi:MAG: glutamate--tRNA ligase, partial [Nitratireductor sp.]